MNLWPVMSAWNISSVMYFKHLRSAACVCSGCVVGTAQDMDIRQLCSLCVLLVTATNAERSVAVCDIETSKEASKAASRL
jgi:hypothetical protein